MEFKLPNFGLFKCRKLIDSLAEIERVWENIEATKISSLALRKVIDDIVHKKSMDEKNTSRLINGLNEVEIILKEEYQEKSLENFIKKTKEIIINQEPKNHLIITLEIIYEKIIKYYNNEKIIEDLKKIALHYMKYVNKDKLTVASKRVLELSLSSKNIVDYFEEKLTKKFFNNENGYNDLDFQLDYGIKVDSELIKIIFNQFINMKIYDILKIKNSKITLAIIKMKDKYFSGDENIDLYKKILGKYEESDVDDLPNLWFKNIEINLGKVSFVGVEEIPNPWKKFTPNQRRIFKYWYTKGKLEDYFKIKVNEPERYLFWKKYLRYINEIDYFHSVGQAIIMELVSDEINLTVIEFGEKGNAAYVYLKEDLSFITAINISKYGDNTSTNSNNKKYKLRNGKNPISLPYVSSKGWNHSGAWQPKFSQKLRSLGYNAY